jgi:hypothetical protein
VIFLHPLALLGLAAAAIPALLHLLERRTPPEAEFPPLRYLRDAERQSARRLRLRHLLLLVLRTSVVVLIVLAAARPILPAGGGAGTVHAPTALAVVLDNSLSSGVVVDGRSVLDRLKAVAHASLEQAAPGDRLWLVLADGVARAGSREALLASLHAATATPQRLDLVSAVERAARVVAAEPMPAREVHVVSDLQRTALGAGRVDVRDVGVLVLAPPARVPANRGIAAVRVTEGGLAIVVSGTPGAGAAPIVARLRLPGGAAARVREAGRTLAAPGQSVTLPLPSLPPGWWVGEVLLDPDELRGDDGRVFVARVAPPAGVAAGADVGPFVAAALAVLRAAKRVADGAEVSIGERPGAAQSIVLPPGDAALVGQVNRALAARGVHWHFGPPGPPGPIMSSELGVISGVSVARRYRLESGAGGRGPGGDTARSVLATVNGEPWLVRDGDVVLLGSRLDTIWTALPAASGFVPFVDALANRIARGQSPVAEAEGAPRAEFVTRGADTVGATVFGPDPRESDLTPAALAELRRALPGARVLDETALAAERFAGTRRADVSGLLLALALLLAAVELAVASKSH